VLFLFYHLDAFWTAFANIKGVKSWPGGLIYGMFF